MTSSAISAIDVHGHFGAYVGDRGDTLLDSFYSGDADVVVRRANAARIETTFVSPLSALKPRRKADSFTANMEASQIVAERPALRQYVVIDPLRPATYAQAADLLARPHCVGIKIHPEEHGYPIAEHGRAIFEFAARHRALVLTHTSEQLSEASEFVAWADEFPEVRVILAHIGCGWDGDVTHQVRAVARSRRGNLFADTSSARSITPGLIEWAVRELGADRVLFGTDTPLYHAAMQRARIDHADLTDQEKRLILRDNALRIARLS
ncbi:MAG TPA: amidohydrolase family protein [Pirellulaceae bacterium]|nr:amidohydrolase family protein [Pirellulaceae bacterium]